MNSHSHFNSHSAAVALCFAALFASTLATGQSCPGNPWVHTTCLPLRAQSGAGNNGNIPNDNGVETSTAATPDGPYPPEHPTVFYHDRDWRIDILPQLTTNDEIVMQIQSKGGDTKAVRFPSYFSQVDSIYRVAKDRAAMIVEFNGPIEALVIADLEQAKLIDQLGVDAPSLSPDRRFLIYVNGYPPHSEEEPPTWYHLYDLSKLPRENVCGYRQNDYRHEDLDESYRGLLVYPRKADTWSCSDDALKPFEDETHDMASDFIWSADSSKVVFADVKGGALSLILVTMPENADSSGEDHHHKDRPQTSIYTFTGAQDVCAGAAYCDNNNIKSLTWNGDAINVALFQANPGGPKIEKDLTVPLSQFVVLSNDKQSSKQP